MTAFKDMMTTQSMQFMHKIITNAIIIAYTFLSCNKLVYSEELNFRDFKERNSLYINLNTRDQRQTDID